ncbi:MAG: pseudouridine synthase [Candidatus Woesearchaeota archaeon]
METEFRVQKLISNYGHCSRRKAEQLIAQGEVKVNGKLIKVGDKAKESDKITVSGKLLKPENKVYIIFNKPVGCLCAVKDARLKTVMDYIRVKERVFPIGRLDYNTCGLLLLTNDGDFANNVMHPRYEVRKTYLVGITRQMRGFEIQQIEKGMMLEDGRTAPAKVRVVKKDEIEITIHEGKNRVIRRMFDKLGIPIRFLMRVRIGKLQLGQLGPGKYKFVKLPPGRDPMEILR